MSILAPTRPPRPSRVRGASWYLTSDIDGDMQSLSSKLQLELLRIRTIDIPQLVREAVEPYKAELSSLSQNVITLKTENQRLQKELEEVNDSVQKLESFSRKDNLKFSGLNERQYETKFDCKRTILSILLDSNINIPPKAIESAHRIGPKTNQRSRPINYS